MASQYALNDSLQVERDLALIELAARLQLLENEAALPGPSRHASGEGAMPPRYAVWVYPRARGRSAMAPAALSQNPSLS